MTIDVFGRSLNDRYRFRLTSVRKRINNNNNHILGVSNVDSLNLDNESTNTYTYEH